MTPDPLTPLREVAILAGFTDAVDRTFWPLPAGAEALICCMVITWVRTPRELGVVAEDAVAGYGLAQCRCCGRICYAPPALPPGVLAEARAEVGGWRE